MATVTAVTPFDMNAYAIVYGDTAFPFPNSFQVQNASQIQGYFGHNFTYDAFGNTGGVLNQTDYYLATPGFGFVLQYSITGLNHDMATVNQFQALNNPQGLLGFLFIDNDTFSGSSGNDFAKGYAGDDSLAGGDGNDTLDGGPGADVLSGGTGSDTYVVDDLGDFVSEAAAEPFPDGDTIIASITYMLPPTMERLVLQGAAALNGTGNAFPNAMTGNDANNVLDGAAGNDTIGGAGGNDTLIGGSGNDALSGGTGNDVYVLDAVGDMVTEVAGAGTDQIQTGVTLGVALAANVETLLLTGSADIDGSGNALANVIYANSGSNVLNGRAGVDTVSYQFGATAGVNVSLAATIAQATGGSGSDTLLSIEHLVGSRFADTLRGTIGKNLLQGAAGNDTLRGGNGNDTLNGGSGRDWAHYNTAREGVTVRLTSTDVQNTGGAGFDTLSSVENLLGSGFDDALTGSSAANHLKGAAGDDALNGRWGDDTLTGNAGQDRFIFSSALNANLNVDTIADFNPAADRIWLDEDVFSAIAAGILDKDAFYAAAGATTASDAEDRVVYNRSNGNLYYDADGSGSASAILFATLTGAPDIVAGDFLIIH
jgi:Ca2+-binding RTX toxin-like protein